MARLKPTRHMLELEASELERKVARFRIVQVLEVLQHDWHPLQTEKHADNKRVCKKFCQPDSLEINVSRSRLGFRAYGLYLI